jgi:hypothetical protein
MALVVRGESVDSVSNPDKSEMIENREGEVYETFMSKSSIIPKRYNDTFNTMAQFNDSIPITVDYYNAINSEIDKQTLDTSFSTLRHSIHKKYHLIHNFELKATSDLTEEINEETTETIVHFNLLIYPGFQANIGDLFLMPLDTGNLAIFIITSMRRLTMERFSYYEATCYMNKMLENGDLEKLNSSVVNEYYFQRDKYFTNNFSLLTTKDFHLFEALSSYREIIVKRYYDYFYNKKHNTLLIDDNSIYDPYVVEFMNKKVSIMETNRRPQQLFTYISDFYYDTIWSLITENEGTNIQYIKKYKHIYEHALYTWSNTITGLFNRRYVIIDDEESNSLINDVRINVDYEYYLFSESFYNGTIMDSTETDEDTVFEKMVYSAITLGEINDPEILITNYLEKFQSLPKEKKFYRMPIYIYLIDLALANIT